MTEAETIEEIKKELSNLPKWVYWAIAILGIVGMAICLLYWYAKRKQGEK